ncbi:MAG: glucose-1-phosphate adenylyltransferase, partial [Paracoccaceae bacterium]|nr:glucose-1-phosphate adenylyltransferase [Paracoccaceae bacterium]
DLIPEIVKHGKAMAHRFSESCVTSGLEEEPYWRDVGTIDAFWQANIDHTDFVPKLDLYDNAWPIWTYAEIVPPAKFIHDQDGRRGMAVSSLISGDCIVSGSEVRNSLLFTGVRTHSWSSLDHVVALPQAVVNRKAELKNCVIDRGVIIPEGLVVGQDPIEDARWFRRTEAGIVLVTQDMLDMRARKLG